MTTTLLDIRFIVERTTGPLEDQWVVDRCNDAHSEFALNLNVPDTDQITINTSDLEYVLPIGLKIINRLWLQSDFDNKIDKEFKWPYRIYNGSIIFRQPYIQDDIMNVDFYKHMTYFTSSTDAIDIDDRFTPLYTSFLLREYNDMPSTKERIGESQAMKEYDKHNRRYLSIQNQVISYYGIQNEPVSVNERW